MEISAKRSLNERDICTQYITPAIQRAGWDLPSRVREEVSYTNGRIIVRGRLVRRGERKRADYILYYKPSLPIAIIEAKDNKHSAGAGMQQALGYAKALDVPLVYSSNGDAILDHDRTATSGQIERGIRLDEFPSPTQLWQRYCAWKGLGKQAQRIVTQDYYSNRSGPTPRYYQVNAINRMIRLLRAASSASCS